MAPSIFFGRNKSFLVYRSESQEKSLTSEAYRKGQQRMEGVPFKLRGGTGDKIREIYSLKLGLEKGGREG